MNKMVRPQLSSVQKIIYCRVIFTFPIAFNKLVSGTVIDAKSVLREKNTSAISAGSHFSYRGSNATRYGEKTIIPQTTGKMKNAIKYNDFSTTMRSASLSFCNLL